MSLSLRIKRPTKNENKELEASLKTIYGDDENLDMTKIERRRGSKLTSFLLRLVGVLFLLALVSWGGFIWWQSGISSPSQPLKVSIEGPEAITSGSAICFKVRYENIGRVPIASLAMSLNLPETFVLKEAKPAATENLNWTMSPLGAGSDGAVDVCGTFRSLVPGSEKVQAVFIYRPANFSSDFQDIAGLTMTVDKSILAEETTGPAETVVGDPITYSTKIKNNGTEKTENLRVRVVLPTSFTIASSEPAVSEVGSVYWDIPALETGAEQTIGLTGSFTGSASGVIPMVFETGFLNAEKTFIKQTETKTETKVMGGELSFTLIANGSDKDQTIDLGNRLRLSINYTNQGQETMEDISFALEINPGSKSLPFNLETSDLAGGVKKENIITWNKSKITALSSLATAATGTIDSTLVLASSIDPNTVADSFTLQIKATIGKIGSSVTSRTISTTPFIIKINSDGKLTAEARYYDEDGAPVGSGSLPPKVDETTTYRVFWTISNSLHDLSSSSATMSLPTNIAWVNNVQADNGSVSFNETTRQVSWKIPTLSKDIKTTLAWFDVAVVPITGDIGKFITLTNPTAFEATDTATNELIQNSTDALTTALPNDELATGKGVVE